MRIVALRIEIFILDKALDFMRNNRQIHILDYNMEIL